ncbi:hypothetical protein [Zhenpiania hominis]|uniref:Uncharacterized protein n=1 Tax=Zhenpiania hominis TaxID=2763644 RepID=A0A923NKF5_9FIRM|nr:hypothetical protein [Zhenpiania hominis]MBC6679545.1 hypothetical protein [Zhenpiania hominis]
MEEVRMEQTLEDRIWDQICQDVWERLNHNPKYQDVLVEKERLLDRYENVTHILEYTSSGELRLSEQEQEALKSLLRLEDKCQEIEQREIYKEGFRHCYFLLKEIERSG